MHGIISLPNWLHDKMIFKIKSGDDFFPVVLGPLRTVDMYLSVVKHLLYCPRLSDLEVKISLKSSNLENKFVNIFLPISLNIRLGCSKDILIENAHKTFF